jgi:hypothetical protein
MDAGSRGGVRPVRLAYQPPANSTFLSEQTSHQQPAKTSQHYSSLRTNQHQPSATSQPNTPMGYHHLTYRGSTTPPRSHSVWDRLVSSLLRLLREELAVRAPSFVKREFCSSSQFSARLRAGGFSFSLFWLATNQKRPVLPAFLFNFWEERTHPAEHLHGGPFRPMRFGFWTG